MASGDRAEDEKVVHDAVLAPSGLRWLWAVAPLRLVVYYSGFLALLLVLRDVPWVKGALDHTRAFAPVADLGRLGSDGSTVSMTRMLQPDYLGVIAIVMVLAMLLAVPVAWVYGWTSPRSSYSKSLAKSLVAFPVAIGTVVYLVKGSLALAFGLAGIVAAVRFRNQLSETRDALFLFVSIGLGLAAGVQLLLLAFVTSAIFNAGMLYLWATDFGARAPQLQGVMLAERAAKRKGTKAKPKDKKASV